VLLLAGLGFIGGSAIYDWLFITKPTDGQVAQAIAAVLPESYQRFGVQNVKAAPVAEGTGKDNVASATLTPKAFLFKPANFEEAATKRGDDPAAFADAVARRSKLDSKTAPPVPADSPLTSLHVHVPNAEAAFSVDVSYRTQKAARRWPLVDCWHIWSGLRLWEFSAVTWPAPPTAAAALRTRQELSGSVGVLGEPQTEEWFRNYVARRKAFIKAVHDHENRTTEQVISDAVRSALAESLKPTGVYQIQSVTPARSNPAVFKSATVIVEQQSDLFRPGKVDALRSSLTALHDSLENARKLATEFLPGGSLTAPVVPAVYDLASPAGTKWTGTVSFDLRNSSTSSTTVENIRWTQEPNWPASPVLKREDTEPNAVFHSNDSQLRTVARYQAEVESYIKGVNEAIAALETRWGKDRELWRLVLKTIAAHGGRERLRQHVGFVEEVAGIRVGAENKEFTFKGSRRTLLPFCMREDFEFTGERVALNQTETLNDRGFWRNGDGAMGPNDLRTPAETTVQRRMAFTKNIIWHLAADDLHGQKLVRGTEPHTLRVSTSTTDFPDVTISVDPIKGLITSARYEDRLAKGHKVFEVRYADFKEFAGVVRATKVEILMDGKPKDTFTVSAWKPAPEMKPEDFRNPYSPGKPFRGRPNAPNHIVEIANTTPLGTPILICFDDNSDTVALGSKSDRTILLEEGEHEMTIVAWIPQISLRQSHRVETRTGRITVGRPMALNVSVDRSANPPISWSVR
jgi:hypothetical protein